MDDEREDQAAAPAESEIGRTPEVKRTPRRKAEDPGSATAAEGSDQKESAAGIAEAVQGVSRGGLAALGARAARDMMALSEGFQLDVKKQAAFFDMLQQDTQKAIEGLRPPPDLLSHLAEPKPSHVAINTDALAELAAMPSAPWETVHELAALREQTVAQAELTRIHVELTRTLVGSTATLIEALRQGQQEQARSNRQLLWLTRVLVALTIVLAIPLVLDGLESVGLIAR